MLLNVSFKICQFLVINLRNFFCLHSRVFSKSYSKIIFSCYKISSFWMTINMYFHHLSLVTFYEFYLKISFIISPQTEYKPQKCFFVEEEKEKKNLLKKYYYYMYNKYYLYHPNRY